MSPSTKPHTTPLLVLAKGPVTVLVPFVSDSVAVGFVVAAAVVVSDPKAAHLSQIQSQLILVDCAHSLSVCCRA